MRAVVHFAAGLLFGIGLALSGMANPQKVLNFLDLAGTWDPSLAVVMAGAIAIAAPGFALAERLAHPVLAEIFDRPAKSPVDRPLLLGSALFGVGWGLVGFCPGPAILSLAFAAPGTIVFVLAMLAGMAIAGRRMDAAGPLSARPATPTAEG